MTQANAALSTILSPPLAASPLDVIVHKAGESLLALRMTNIAGRADKSDAQSLESDILAVARIVDPIIQAIGDYAREHFNGIDKSLFVDQLRGAVEGNAVYAISAAAEAMAEEAAAPDRHHHARRPSYAG